MQIEVREIQNISIACLKQMFGMSILLNPSYFFPLFLDGCKIDILNICFE